MTNGDPPTLGEVIRRLEAMSKQIDKLTTQMEDDRRHFDEVYVPREVYEARHSFVKQRIDAIEEREKGAAGFRRQVIGGLIIAFVPAMVALLLAINNFLANGGVTP